MLCSTRVERRQRNRPLIARYRAVRCLAAPIVDTVKRERRLRSRPWIGAACGGR